MYLWFFVQHIFKKDVSGRRCFRNYTHKNKVWPNYCLEQNSGIKSNLITHTKDFNLYNYINLPNSSFFESTGTYLTTNGYFKNNIKFISSSNQIKEDWQIIRKLFSNFKNVKFLNSHNSFYLVNNQTNFNLLKSFFTFIYYASTTINYKNNYSYNKKGNNFYYQKVRKNLKDKLLCTKISVILNDFYIGGNDSYSRYSSTMIKCSKQLRLTKNNFSHLL